MQTFLLTLLCTLPVLSAFAAVVGWRSWPLFLCASLVMLVVCVVEFYLSQRRRLRPTALPRSDISDHPGMMSPQEITATLERVRRFLNDDSGVYLLPQPQKAVTVACSACDVAEVYPEGHGNDAAKSPHLLTHPDRCMVVGIRQ